MVFMSSLRSVRFRYTTLDMIVVGFLDTFFLLFKNILSKDRSVEKPHFERYQSLITTLIDLSRSFTNCLNVEMSLFPFCPR
jgi:hypothetical protein